MQDEHQQRPQPGASSSHGGRWHHPLCHPLQGLFLALLLLLLLLLQLPLLYRDDVLQSM